MFLLNSFLIFIICNFSNAEGLPDVPVPQKWKVCSQDKDCAVAGDACRSCGVLTIINHKYLSDYNKLDYKLRKKADTHITCEACSTKDVKVFCKNNVCAYSK